jgi:glyoxylase-like metal-dependent hydrolase (beta-lactamase superfamily II)
MDPVKETTGTSEEAALKATVYTSSWPTLPDGGTFSPTTSTLITGPTEAVLVDAQFLTDDVVALGDLVESTGKTLTTIYITHGHADHYLGLGPLLKRFPDARCVAKPDVIDYMVETRDYQRGVWNNWFGDACVEFGQGLPDPLSGNTMLVDGHPLDIIEVGQADISPTTVVHVPAISTVVAGDAVYNRIHPMLALTTPEEWQGWIASIDAIERLQPTAVVAGHKMPGASDEPAQELIDSTRQYIRDFADAAKTATSPEDLEKRMLATYPDYGNPWTLKLSARMGFERSKATSR